jgi:hypothetical protein
MASAVYVLCAVMSILCSVLLFRGYSSSRNRLLLWSACCFAGLALNNLLLLIDLVMIRDVDLALLRAFTAIGSLAVLLFGLVWESK